MTIFAFLEARKRMLGRAARTRSPCLAAPLPVGRLPEPESDSRFLGMTAWRRLLARKYSGHSLIHLTGMVAMETLALRAVGGRCGKLALEFLC